jgi:hypothetical protein
MEIWFLNFLCGWKDEVSHIWQKMPWKYDIKTSMKKRNSKTDSVSSLTKARDKEMTITVQHVFLLLYPVLIKDDNVLSPSKIS